LHHKLKNKNIMENNLFLKTIKDFIAHYEEFSKTDNIESFIDLGNEELKELCIELGVTQNYYINIADLISKKLEQNINEKNINPDSDTVRNHTQDVIIYSLCCYGIDLINELLEKICGLISINNQLLNSLK